MKYKPYPVYKDSGVEWLGKVPAHWDVKRLGYYFAERREKVSDRDYQPLSITKNGVVPQLETAAKTDDGDNRKLVCAGDFVINSRSDRKGSSGLSELAGSVSLINTVLQPYDLIDGRFAHHLLRSYPFQEEFYRYGKGIVADLWSTNYSEMRNISLSLPNPAEQTSIATVLDRETAKLDTLIAKQEKLIELLQEKLQALISHAVTKGLNPDAPMKDSGVEWLGEVPAHWGVLPLKRDLLFLTSGSRGWADHYADDGALFIRIGNLTRETIQLDLADIQRVEVPEGTEGERTRVLPGDVLFSITAYLGSVAVVPDNMEAAYVSQHVALARLAGRYFLSPWVAYVTLSFVGKTYLAAQGYGGTKIQLSLDDVANILMTSPPSEEQSAIVAFIDRETAKLDTLVEKSRRSIELMREHRTALISAAVTGKIDVRARHQAAA
ncbi:hypothetical protein [Thiobacillus sp.]|uniref:hypothetical protein n=1 Tax=Thiobacillus sp. TaxID=924 RepID=UPI001AC2FF95|nr:hypothetical protein [Thiobacillus sp.]MBN8777929.1 hypothetical protein [Thiobacillus sp.]